MSEEQIAEKRRSEELQSRKQEKLEELAKPYEKEFEQYQKQNNLDKPDVKTFENFRWSTNRDNTSAYIRGQKPETKEKAKGLRRIFAESISW